MSHIINRVLEKTIGIKLTRAKIRKVYKTKKNPIYVEFVGIAGVGKTTLYNTVFEEIKKEWRNIHELQRIFKEHNDSKAIESSLRYQKLADYKMESLKSREISGLDKMNIVKYFHSVLVADSIMHIYNKDYDIISEEGLIHNFGESIYKLFTTNKEETKNLMKNRAVIYCKTSPEIVADRILERQKKTGVLLPQHKVCSYDELVSLQKKSLALKHQFIDFLSEYGIPVLSIDTSNSMIENVIKTKSFLSELTNRTQTFFI